MPETPDLEQRLREHLGRLAAREAPHDLERRVIAAVTEPQPKAANTWSTAALMIVLVVTLVVLLTVVAGHQVTNVFSNVSSGLSS
jgi:hypothetical protein